MAFTHYRHDDAGAPVLDGTADSIITLLDAILINGYGSKPAAGWTKPFTGSGKAVYRMSNSTGRGYYLRVVDNGDTNRSCRWKSYGEMTSVDAGTWPLPDYGASDGFYIKKSDTSDSVARQWFCTADSMGIFLYICPSSALGNSAAQGQVLYMSVTHTDLAGDPGPVLVIGRENTTFASSYATPLAIISNSSSVFAAASGHYYSHTWYGQRGVFAANKKCVSIKVLTSSISDNGGDWPLSQATGRIMPFDILLHETDTTNRGKIPMMAGIDGSWSVGGSSWSINAGTVFNITLGDYAGQSFMLIPVSNVSVGGNDYAMLMQTVGSR